jgi:hypothetical protein
MLAMVALMMMAMLGVAAMVVDVGRVFISYHELVASTDAAALAGGEALGQPGSTVATSGTAGSSSLSTNEAVNAYSSTSSDKNAYSNLSGVTTTVTPECLTTLKTDGIPCYGAGSYNAIQVTQTVSMPTTFAALFGTPTVLLTATATAAMAGAATTPYNVAIIVDTTGSMSDTDSDCAFSGNSNPTRLQCSLYGVRTLLGELFPCASQLSTCSVNTTTGVATNPVDQVGLFTFPNITTATTSSDQKCPVGTPTTESAYAFPSSTLTATSSATASPATGQFVTFTPSGKTAVTMTYEVTWINSGTNPTNGFLSDYRSSDTASSLNTSSILTIASGGASCAGITNPGGAGTFYGGVLYAAADALIAEEVNTPSAQPAIILVSDGDASATQQQMAGGSGAPGSDTGTGAINATSSGTYPSWKNECHQAITAAQNIVAGGFNASGAWSATSSTTYSKKFRIYAVAYGAESSGCTTDSPSITPCTTMGDIASSPVYFYSDYTQSGGGQDTSCTGTGGSGDKLTNISEIFSAIFTTFTVARLIPNSTT